MELDAMDATMAKSGIPWLMRKALASYEPSKKFENDDEGNCVVLTSMPMGLPGDRTPLKHGGTKVMNAMGYSVLGKCEWESPTVVVIYQTITPPSGPKQESKMCNYLTEEKDGLMIQQKSMSDNGEWSIFFKIKTEKKSTGWLW